MKVRKAVFAGSWYPGSEKALAQARNTATRSRELFAGPTRQITEEQLDFDVLEGLSGAESAPILRKAVQELGTRRSSNYWDSTAGNVGHICSVLLSWAERLPNYRWGMWK